MTKKDLKNGMIVETREGTRYLYCEGVMRGLDEWDLISNYTDDLKCTEFPDLDIVKVYEDTREYSLDIIFKYEYLKLIWKRPETPKLSEREIEILKALDTLGFTYIARDSNMDIYAYQTMPDKLNEHISVWVNGETQYQIKEGLFSFVKCEDKEPTSIKKLLEQVKE